MTHDEPIPRAALEYAITRLVRNLEAPSSRKFIQDDLDFIIRMLDRAGFSVDVPKDGLATIRQHETK